MPLDPKPLIAEAASLAMLGADAGLALRLDLADGLEVAVDPIQLQQVLINLIRNAVEAVTDSPRQEIVVTARAIGSAVAIEVADRGPGITPDKVEQIFEPFYTSQPGGTGLGLYISRELAERNGAALRYQPRAGGGSVFRIVFADPKRWQSSEDSL